MLLTSYLALKCWSFCSWFVLYLRSEKEMCASSSQQITLSNHFRGFSTTEIIRYHATIGYWQKTISVHNKIGKVYCLEYADIPKVFMQHHVDHRCTVIRGHYCALTNSCTNVTRGHCYATMCSNNEHEERLKISTQRFNISKSPERYNLCHATLKDNSKTNRKVIITDLLLGKVKLCSRPAPWTLTAGAKVNQNFKNSELHWNLWPT
jgi:hypothetical protein